MWREKESVAQWFCEHWQASVELQQPKLGLHGLSVGVPISPGTTALCVMSRALEARSSAQLVDHYVRDHDLVAVYQDVDQDVRTETYWRVPPLHPDAVILETLVSIQTQLLDEDPTVDIGCGLPAASCRRFAEPGEVRGEYSNAGPIHIEAESGSCALSLTLTQSPWVATLLFDTADVVSASLSPCADGSGMTCALSFFGGRLEKGVIRRTRLRAIVSESSRADELLRGGWNDLSAAPPPLAT